MSIESIAVVARAPVASRRVRHRAIAVATCLLVTLAAFGCTRAWFDRRDALTSTRAELHQTRRDLASSSHHVALAQQELAAATATLARAQSSLDAKTAARDASAARLAGTNSRLLALRDQLTAAAGDLLTRGAHLTTLQECVLGVARALNQASVGDVGGLQTMLSDVAATCTSAGVKL
jgi:septal ring factor EnvC (AmiA/AmiB activator)